MKFIALAGLVIALALPANVQAQSKHEKRVLALLARSPETLEPLVTVQGDSLDPAIQVNTKGVTAIVNKGWIASTTVENSFLRAYINKKSGTISSQIYHYAVSGEKNAPSFYRATFETPDGIKEVNVDRIAYDVSCGRYGCTHYEDIGVPIDFSILEAAALKYNPSDTAQGIKYRLFGRSGETLDEGVPVNEIVAFVAVVKREQAKLQK